MQYTQSALNARIIETLYTNTLGEISALDMRQLMIDMLDSLVVKGSSSGGGLEIYQGNVANSNLDVDNEVTVNHLLDTEKPFVIVFNQLGESLGSEYFTATPSGANALVLHFEDDIPVGVQFSYLVVKLTPTAEAIVLNILTEAFENWQSDPDPYEDFPDDWNWYSQATRGADNNVYNDSNAARFICGQTTALLMLYHVDALTQYASYQVTFRYRTLAEYSPGHDLFITFGARRISDGQLDITSINLAPTNSVWTEITYNFSTNLSGAGFIFGISADGVNVDIAFDTITLDML